MKKFYLLFKESASEWIEDKASQHGAALAYYSVFSIGPLLLIIIALAALIFGQSAVEARVTSELQGFLGKDGAQVLVDLLRGARENKAGGIIATIVGGALLLFTASGVVYQLKSSLNEMWKLEPDPDRSFWWTLKDRLLSLAGVLGLGFLLIVSLALSAAVSALVDLIQSWVHLPPAVFRVASLGVSLLVLTLAFALMFRFLPDAKVEWRDTWIGALFTAILFTLGKWVIGWYLGSQSLSSTYGAAGSLMIVLLWVYYSSQILFFGAEMTQVYARLHGDEIEPAKGTIRGTDHGKSADQRRSEALAGAQEAQTRPTGQSISI